MNIQLQRDKLIQQIQVINDVDLLKTIKSLLDYSSKKEMVFEVPQRQQDEVLQRLNEGKENPSLVIDRNTLNKKINSFVRK